MNGRVVEHELQRLVRQECSEVFRGYGGSYHFRFSSALLTDSNEDKSLLSIYYSDFTISNHDSVISLDTKQIDIDDPSQIKQIDKILQDFVGLQVTNIATQQPDLALYIKFSDERQLHIMPRLVDINDEDIRNDATFWDIDFSSGKMILAGPLQSITLEHQE